MVFRSLPLTAKFVGIAAAAIMLPACATMQNTKSAAGIGDDQYREAIGVYSSAVADDGMDPIAAAAFWGTRYNTDQSNPEVAVNFSRALRRIGSIDEAVGVMQKSAARHEDNAGVSLEYGKVLVESGRAFEAVRYLETASSNDPSDWRALSAYGVALDQIGEHKEARKKYEHALTIAPHSVTVMNNKGLSFAMDGNLAMARNVLREAAAGAGGDARVRQNLALVLALSGDMQGAERLARSDLPPIVADNNIDVYRQLMNQPAYWSEYAASSAETPAFDGAPLAPVSPTQKPRLQEEPKQEEEKSNGAPIALIEAAPLTNASVTAAPQDPESEDKD